MIFGNMFDFNRDGKLDSVEQAAELAFLDELMSEELDESGDSDVDGFDPEYSDSQENW